MVICRFADRVSALRTISSLVYFLCDLVVEQNNNKDILISVGLSRAGSELYSLLGATSRSQGTTSSHLGARVPVRAPA